MINLKNSLKKILAGTFGILTMLSPLQSAQCYIYGGEEHKYYKCKTSDSKKSPCLLEIPLTYEIDASEDEVAKLNDKFDDICERTYELFQFLPEILLLGKISKKYSECSKKWAEIVKIAKELPDAKFNFGGKLLTRDKLCEIVSIEADRISGSDSYGHVEMLFFSETISKPLDTLHDLAKFCYQRAYLTIFGWVKDVE